jgi:type 1 fimbria pilin
MKNWSTLATLGTLLLASSGCGTALFDNSSYPVEVVGVGCRVSSSDWSFSCDHVFMKKNEPILVFGTYDTPTGDREISYLWIFSNSTFENIQTEEQQVDHGKSARLSFDGEVAAMSNDITVYGNRIELDVEFQTNDETSTVQTTKFTIDGKDIDTTKGLVFLVDLASDAGNYEQVNAKLPSDFPALETPGNVETLARQIIKKLKNENDRVREFLAE